MRSHLLLVLLACLAAAVSCNKYSKEANEKVQFERDPFRMAKLNLLWEKALKVSRQGFFFPNGMMVPVGV